MGEEASRDDPLYVSVWFTEVEDDLVEVERAELDRLHQRILQLDLRCQRAEARNRKIMIRASEQKSELLLELTELRHRAQREHGEPGSNRSGG